MNPSKLVAPLVARLGFERGLTRKQYDTVRMIFGLYLTVHFVHLLPWAAELFSRAGTLPEASLSPYAFVFPNILSLYDAPWFATAFVVAGAVASVLFAAGWRDRFMAVGIWYVWACLFGRNPLIANPSLAFVGWMLLMHALLPAVKDGVGWKVPPSFVAAAWIVKTAGYTYSGLTKLASPSWVDGLAIAEVLKSPLARTGPIHAMMLEAPEIVLKLVTWSTLGLELLALPLALFARLRPALWFALLGLHVGILATVAFADLTVGMLMIHLVTFDPRTLTRVRHRRKGKGGFILTKGVRITPTPRVE